MTENTTELKLCIMGSATEIPCVFPATVALPHKSLEDGGLCVFHAAMEPLVDESNELDVCLELVRTYLEDARGYAAARPLARVLERAEADFCARLGLIERVLEGLEAAELRDMRG